MRKINNKGFALAETLIVTVFVMYIFSVIYFNYTPLIAEYEKRETYDDLDGKYAAYWMKRLIELDEYTLPTIPGTGAVRLNFTDLSTENPCLSWNSHREMCEELVKELEITNVYITSYQLSDIKKKTIVDNFPDLNDYIESLPEFNTAGSHGNHRVIVQMRRKINREVQDVDNTTATQDDGTSTGVNVNSNEYDAFATIEVK